MASKQLKEAAPSTHKGNGQLMALGEFVFELSTMVYQQIDRQNSWRHPSTERVGARPAYQFTGPGAESFNLSGVIYKEFSNPKALDTLRDMADAGEAYVMVNAAGKVFGLYVIDDVSEQGSFFDREGNPLKIEFTLKLTRVDDAAGTEGKEV